MREIGHIGYRVLERERHCGKCQDGSSYKPEAEGQEHLIHGAISSFQLQYPECLHR